MRISAAVSRADLPAPRIEEVELGQPRADEVLVRVAAAGICHTDLRAHQGVGLPIPRPIVLGHEGAGVIEQVGDAVIHLKPGDHVVMSGSSCGRCPSCLDKHPSYCTEGIARCFGGQRLDGSSALSQQGTPLHGHFFGQSSFATHAVADGRGAVAIPADIPLHIAAPLGCGGITGAGAVLCSFGLRPGQSLAVFGTGGVGLSAVMAAHLSGAQHILAIDPVAARRKLAQELGATVTIDPGSEDVVAALRGAVPAGVDFCLITSREPDVFQAAIHSAAMRGVVGFVAAPWEPCPVRLYELLAGGRSLRGIVGGDADPQVLIPMLLEQWRKGRFPIERLITTYPFEHIGQAFGAFHQATVIKPVVLLPA
jgi:aryl-alcohol dehydrogenase